MKLVGRIPVEPLADERLVRIERQIVARAAEVAPRAQRRGLGRLVVLAAMVAAGALGWWLRPSPAAIVAEPAAVHVERGVLDIGDARIASDAATSFEVTRPAGGVLVALARGEVALEVAKRAGRPPLIVRAGDTDVVVVGTRFSVAFDGTTAEVRVTEGVVRVVHAQQETPLTAGQAWRTREGKLAIAELRDGRDGHNDARGDAARAMASGAVRGSGDVMRDERARPRDDAKAPRGDVLRDERAKPRDEEHDDVGHDVAKPRVDAKPRPIDPQADLRAEIRAQRVEPALAIDERDAARAVAKYYAIAAHTSGEDASRAFYSIAVIRHLRLGRNADALQTLDGYVRRFPGGKEYRAALWLRVRILCLDKLDDRCRAAAYTYLHETAEGPAAEVAERITQTE